MGQCEKLSAEHCRVRDRLVSASIVQDLTVYMRNRLHKEKGPKDLLQMCDVLLTCADLLVDLFPTNLSLADLNDLAKARALREKLIKADKLEMAMRVAKKCNIETEPMWAAWGLYWIKLGNYNEAKIKFETCFG